MNSTREITLHFDNGSSKTWRAATADEARYALHTALARPTREIWLDSGRDNALSALVSQDQTRAILIPMNEDGLHSVASDYDVLRLPPNVTFLLANGQADVYARQWTVPVMDALRAIEYTFATGHLAPWITWDDGDTWGGSDPLPPADARITDLIRALDSLESAEEPDDLHLLEQTLEELERRPDAARALPALFHIFERFPHDDGYGVFWGILHFLEAQPGYEGGLQQSLLRFPTEFTLTMVRRILNDAPTPDERRRWLMLARDIAADPRRGDYLRLDAVHLLDNFNGWEETDA